MLQKEKHRMDRNNRPKGRQKKTSNKRGSVSRRGGGISKKTGGSVGGYKKTNSSSSFRPSTSSTGGSRQSGGLSLKTIIILGVIFFVGYMILQMLTGSDQAVEEMPSFDSSQVNNDVATSDYDSGYSVDRAISPLSRERYTDLIGNGDDTVTLMIFMLGTDLESRSGMATADLNEILSANIADNVNIVIETGGTKEWKNNVISNKTNQRYQATAEGLVLVEDNIGNKSMVDPNTLADFIQFSKDNYPASRYQLIMWDHGGGSLTGYGYDELHKGDSMTLDEIQTALKKGGVKFDFIGYDACLMGTLETAIAMEPYADYMIASEELEPGIGWYYTEWISTLSDNTSIPTIDLGKKLIDDYVAKVEEVTPKSQATLSLIDLAELKGTLAEPLADFSASTNTLIEEKQYEVVAGARAGAKEFAERSKINQIDLIDFANKVGTTEALNLASVLDEAIKYNRTSSNISNANGVSIYFPYNQLGKLEGMLDTYDEIGMDDEYSEVVKSFASVVAGGQVVASGSNNMMGSLTGEQSTGGSVGGAVISQLLTSFLGSNSENPLVGLAGGATSWLNGNLVEESADYYAENQFDASALTITKKNGENVISLTEKQWSMVQYMEQNVFIDDGSGFIDLGLDNVYEWNDDGDLLMAYDGTWLAINDQVVSYYLISDTHDGYDYTILGRVPVLLNGYKADIILSFTDEDPHGTVLGATENYDAADTEAFAKGFIELMNGDQIEYIADYYTYAGKYVDTYRISDPITVTGEWTIENIIIDQYDYQMSYRFTDIYNNHYWSETVTK